MADDPQYDAVLSRYHAHVRRHGLKQYEVAAAIQRDQSTVSRWVNNKMGGSTRATTQLVATWLDAQNEGEGTDVVEAAVEHTIERASSTSCATQVSADITTPPRVVSFAETSTPQNSLATSNMVQGLAWQALRDCDRALLTNAMMEATIVPTYVPESEPDPTFDDMVRGLGRLQIESVQNIARAHEITRNARRAGEVYILRMSNDRLMHKIGYTTRSAKERLREMQTGNPLLELAAQYHVHDAPGVEEAAHSILSAYRAHGGAGREWFVCTFLVAQMAVAKAIAEVD